MDMLDLVLWAMEHHYPYITLDEKDTVYAGETAWNDFMAFITEEQMRKLLAKVKEWQQWEHYIQKEEAS